MRINLACAECGQNRFAFEGAETDDCLIHCEDCGHKIGTLRELKQRVALAVLGGRSDETARH
jgi:uncharacterized Zn finger protein